MNKLSLTEKIDILLKSSKEYRGPLLICLLFFVVGVALIYIGVQFDFLPIIIFGAVFSCFSLVVFAYTIPSSIVYYYEKAVITKYGKFTNAYLLSKQIIDNSHFDSSIETPSKSKKGKLIEELNYLIEYSFKHNDLEYQNSEFIKQAIFEKLTIGDTIPIKFLSTNPNNNSVRTQKLKNSFN